ncbi:MAG: N-acetylglutaminylglutamine amidotransferase [Planctomycetales bacterium]|nr:N-acetylglutaminylglutamine amidotransferase [Planctomycetales bacterium]
MCGICGELRFDGTDADEAAVAAMADRMRQRGPDSQGRVMRGNWAFGHRRLKIIDLSDASQQPLVDSELGLTVVFNGAIYNYAELRSLLETQGYRFFSHGDTEVILKAYHAWGAECLRRFNGMFALAIYERDTGRTFLARDRLGIKPLYYAEGRGRLRFASSVPALLAGGDVDDRIDAAALNFYLTFHSVVPPPRTILRGVRKLPPATWAMVEPTGEMKQESYWTLRFGRRPDQHSYKLDDWIEETLDVLRKAVKRRLVADVPVGALLSGGLDSSLIVGLICEEGGPTLDTFSIGFESVGSEEGDEFKYSDIIAERFGTRHHKMFIDASRTLPALRECIREMSEPMVSHDNVGFYLLSREVAKHCKVVQSGQGADEVFGGYHWYPPMLDADDPLATYRRHFFDRDFAEYLETVSDPYATDDVSNAYVSRHFGRPGAEAAIDKALRIDSLVMLVDDPVKRVDNHTMAASLEARVPFLDHEAVEFAATAPPEMKIAGGGKYVVKEAARQVIPAEVIDRPKGYFPVPALKFLKGAFLEMARDALTAPAAQRRGLFRQAYVDRLLAAPEAHLTPLRGSKLWQLALLELWLQEHLR